MSAISERSDTDLIQFSTAVSVVCAIVCTSTSYKLPKWRKINYMYSKQILVKCLATCCIICTILLPQDMRDTLLIMYFILVLAATLGTLHNAALAHIYIVLSCQEIEDEESKVSSSWYRTVSVTSVILYSVHSAFKLELVNIGNIVMVLLLGLDTGNITLLSSIFKAKCNINVTLVWFVNTLGILSDMLLVLCGFLLMYMDDAQWAYDVVVVTCTGVTVVQTFVILISKDAMDRRKCCSRTSDLIEM